jgi:hypothetical protein
MVADGVHRASVRLAGRAAAVLGVVLLAGLWLAPPEAGESTPRRAVVPSAAATPAMPLARPPRRAGRPQLVPTVAAVHRAWRYARRRGGLVSIAVVDTRGRLRGRRAGVPYVSASLVKPLLLVAELRRLRRAGAPLDAATAGLLRAMITFSDNDAADAIYARTGDAGLVAVARSARMRRFAAGGHWAAARLTAADMARFFSRLRRLTAGPHRRTALRLLASVVEEQRWGLPRAAGRRWTVRFKGGWRTTLRGELVHQAGRLHRGRRDLAIAILTDGQPSRGHAIRTVHGIAARLLG